MSPSVSAFFYYSLLLFSPSFLSNSRVNALPLPDPALNYDFGSESHILPIRLNHRYHQHHQSRDLQHDHFGNVGSVHDNNRNQGTDEGEGVGNSENRKRSNLIVRRGDGSTPQITLLPFGKLPGQSPWFSAPSSPDPQLEPGQNPHPSSFPDDNSESSLAYTTSSTSFELDPDPDPGSGPNNMPPGSDAPVSGLTPQTTSSPIPLSRPTSLGGPSTTYPRMVLLTDNSLLSIFTSFRSPNSKSPDPSDHGTGRLLRLTRSTDGGLTWGDGNGNPNYWGTVAETPSSGPASMNQDVDNAQIVQLPNTNGLGGGRILAAFRNHTMDGQGGYTFYRITVCASDDWGRNWRFMSQVDERPAKPENNGIWEPFMRVTRTGAVQVYYAAELNATDQDILMKTSYDGGSTWSAPIIVAGQGIDARDGMPGISSYVDGRDGQQKLICVFESTMGTMEHPQGFKIFSVESADDGQTWGDRRMVYYPTGTDNNAGSPQVVTTTTNKIVVSFMTDEDKSPHAWPSGANFKVVTSHAPTRSNEHSDSDFVWGSKTTIFETQASWPGMLALGNGVVLGAADHNGQAQVKSLELV